VAALLDDAEERLTSILAAAHADCVPDPAAAARAARRDADPLLRAAADPASLASFAASLAAGMATAIDAPAPLPLPPAAAATPAATGAAPLAPLAPSKAAAGLRAVLGVDSLSCPHCAVEFLKPDEYVRHVDGCCPGLGTTGLASAGLVRCPAHGCGELRSLIAPSLESRSDYYRHVQIGLPPRAGSW